MCRTIAEGQKTSRRFSFHCKRVQLNLGDNCCPWQPTPSMPWAKTIHSS